jgi:hypothetical protein
MIPSTTARFRYGRSVPISHSNSEQRPTCKMTPEQLLGLQRTARAKTATLTPEISIVDPDAAPTVIMAEGTQESVPIVIDDQMMFDQTDEVDDVIQALAAEPTPDHREADITAKDRPGPLGAVIGFALFAVVTAAEILVVVLS